MASAETVRDRLLPAETTGHEKWLPAETARVILHGQSLQEAVNQAQQSRQEARDRGQSRQKPNMTDSLCRKRKLADSFIPCVMGHTPPMTPGKDAILVPPGNYKFMSLQTDRI